MQDVNEEFLDFLKQCLIIEPDKRPQPTALLSLSIFEVEKEEPKSKLPNYLTFNQSECVKDFETFKKTFRISSEDYQPSIRNYPLVECSSKDQWR